MAIDTTNEQLALMESEQVYEPGLPMVSASTIDNRDQRQLLWGYPFDIVTELESAFSRGHHLDVFHGPNWTWLYPTSFAAPEIVPYLPEILVDTEECFVRRPDEDHLCLRRPDESEQALRRAPECPDQFACPSEGCV